MLVLLLVLDLLGFSGEKANPISPGNDLFHCSDGERKNLPSSSLHGRDFEHELRTSTRKNPFRNGL
jgi:hypothetical protein